jgi:hypothetical protein
MLATRADRAIKASGVGQIFIYDPPAMGGRLKSTDLPSQVFDFDRMAFMDDGMDVQREILNRIPSQLAGLELKLEEAVALGQEQLKRSSPRVPRARFGRSDWVNHPWTITIVGTVIAGVIAGIILALILGGN